MQVPRFRMRNIKALFILNIEEINFFKIRSKCITFVGIDHMHLLQNSSTGVLGLRPPVTEFCNICILLSLRVSGVETFCFFETWRPGWDSNPQSPSFQAGSFNHCTRTPAPGTWRSLYFTSAGALVQWLKLPVWKFGDRGFEPHSGRQVSKKQNVCSPLIREDSVLCPSPPGLEF